MLHGDGTNGTTRLRSVGHVLAELEGLVGELVALDPGELGGFAAAEAATRLHRLSDRLRAQQVGWLGRVEADAAWVGTGARSFAAWVERTLDVPFSEARRLARMASVLRDILPATLEAARAGAVSTAKGWLIAATATTPERIAALRTAPEAVEEDTYDAAAPDGSARAVDDAEGADSAGRMDAVGGADSVGHAPHTGEQVLLALAGGYRVGEFAKITRRFSHVTDPEADERGYRQALAREFFDLAATTDGYHLSGFVTRDHGQVLKTALRAVSGVPANGDTRSSSQRRAGALTSLARLPLDHGVTGTVGTVRPHLSVHVTHTELSDLLHRTGTCIPASDPGGARPAHSGSARTGPGLAALVTAPPAQWEDGSGPVPDSVLARLAADCEVSRVVFGPGSQVLDVGRTRRTFTGQLRRAVVARDRACVVDGCAAPAFLGQIHHARVRWADGGTTSVDNAALVCGFHNQWIEDHRIPMRRVDDGHGAVRWQLGVPGTYRPDGSGDFPGPDPPEIVDRDTS